MKNRTKQKLHSLRAARSALSLCFVRCLWLPGGPAPELCFYLIPLRSSQATPHGTCANNISVTVSVNASGIAAWKHWAAEAEGDRFIRGQEWSKSSNTSLWSQALHMPGPRAGRVEHGRNVRRGPWFRALCLVSSILNLPSLEKCLCKSFPQYLVVFDSYCGVLRVI